MSLSQQRCVLHPDREAVARCPECKRFFCRECVTEHDGRLLCATCINHLSEPREEKPARTLAVVAVAQRVGKAVALAGSLLVLVTFYMLVAVLLSAIPHRFHDSSALSSSVTREAKD